MRDIRELQALPEQIEEHCYPKNSADSPVKAEPKEIGMSTYKFLMGNSSPAYKKFVDLRNRTNTSSKKFVAIFFYFFFCSIITSWPDIPM